MVTEEAYPHARIITPLHFPLSATQMTLRAFMLSLVSRSFDYLCLSQRRRLP